MHLTRLQTANPSLTRNSSAATAKLLQDVNCCQVVATSSTLGDLLSQTQLELEQHGKQLSIHEMPLTQTLYPLLGRESSETAFEYYTTGTSPSSLSDVAFYLHSSGSTGLPKAIPQSHLSNLHWCSFQCVNDIALHRPALRINASMLPSFHTLGVYFQFLVPMVTLRVINISPPLCPSAGCLPFQTSPASVLDHAEATNCNAVATFPSILELWASDSQAVQFLRTMAIVWFSGGTLSTQVGNNLSQRGIKLSSIYGATEYGAPVHTVPRVRDIADGDWSYIRFDSRAAIQWVSRGSGLYEAIIMATETHQLSACNVAEGFATSDLFERHPSKDLWKIVARVDDVIVLSSGEKLVPAPAEDLINSSPLVSLCMFFGREQQNVGVIVQPLENIRSEDETAVNTFKESIRSLLEEANSLNPAWARVFFDMVIVTDARKPLIRSAKGSLHRTASLVAFKMDISSLYEKIKFWKVPDAFDALKAGSTAEELTSWLAQQAADISGKEVWPDIDLFEQGFDSLTATALRTRLIAAATVIQSPSAEEITLDWVYQHPTIVAMSGALVNTAAERPAPVTIESLLDMYTPMISSTTIDISAYPTAQAQNTCAVLLTGSTGALGSFILADLIKHPDVDAIYCLSRVSGSSKSLLDRHCEVFNRQALDKELLTSPKVRLLPADLLVADLGLGSDTLTQIKTSRLRIIHAAWRVDFNLSLASFNPHVKGVVNLINLASECPSFQGFCLASSVSSAQGWDRDSVPVPEALVDVTHARGQAYGESKYIAERLIAESKLPSTCIRIGQICGSRLSGSWSSTEWFPILVKSSIYMGAFPLFPGVASWIPLDEVADISVAIALQKDASSGAVVNVVHSDPVPWSDIASWVVKAVGEPNMTTVSAEAWFNCLALRRKEELADLVCRCGQVFPLRF
ncbi:acetyl-CoA synthetase-like protein [Hymenopellis radicata]|nr:acetyl-CoA synthetase-like protein [Hymenopellis radicata]